MKRTAPLAFVLALCTVLALTGAVLAKDHTSSGNSGAHGNGHDGGTASLRVKGNASHPGGVLRVLAVLHAAKDLRPATINAIVHFSTGDVAVVLTHNGNGAAYHGNVPVPGAEPAGVVKIDATAIVNGVTVTATGSGKIVVETTETSETTTETSETTTETSTTCTVTTTETATSTVTATETSTTSATSETSESAESSESSETSESSESSEASESSDNDESDSCGDESPHPSSFVLNPQSMREFVAFLAALIN